MKTKLPAFVFALALVTLGPVSALSGAEVSDPLSLDCSFETSEPVLAASLYAPSDSAFHWGVKPEGWSGWFAIEVPLSHPSLAADLMGRATDLPSEELVSSEAESPIVVTPSRVDEPIMIPEALELEGGQEVQTVHNVSGIPHPLAAGMAALVGLALVIGRKEQLT